MIPKRGVDYCDIGLLEVVCKEVTVIINRRFTARFWAGCGMGTATLEVKLLHQVADMREAVLHTIFLDLHKS